MRLGGKWLEDEMFREFVAATAVNVRIDADRRLVDKRETMLAQLLACGVEKFIEFMGEVPHDAASLLTLCAWITDPRAVQAIAGKRGEMLKQEFARLSEEQRLPIAVRKGHPAAKLVTELCAHPEGRILYRDIAQCLLYACEHKGLLNVSACANMPCDEDEEVGGEDLNEDLTDEDARANEAGEEGVEGGPDNE